MTSVLNYPAGSISGVASDFQHNTPSDVVTEAHELVENPNNPESLLTNSDHVTNFINDNVNPSEEDILLQNRMQRNQNHDNDNDNNVNDEDDDDERDGSGAGNRTSAFVGLLQLVSITKSIIIHLSALAICGLTTCFNLLQLPTTVLIYHIILLMAPSRWVNAYNQKNCNSNH